MLDIREIFLPPFAADIVLGAVKALTTWQQESVEVAETIDA